MKKKFVYILLMMAAMNACRWLSVFETSSVYQTPTPRGCVLPPEGFKDEDLIGTWIASRGDTTDTLIIRGDGKYKQIIHKETPLFDYESDWQTWWVEHSESGTPHLHLEGMRLCATIGVSCDQIGGGENGWYDFCDDEWIFMPGKVVLPVLGIPEGSDPPPRSIQLIHFLEFSWGYRLQEP